MVVSPRMRIPLVAGVGRGSTLLSAFDDALCACGALNYNVISLSSVIPPATDVVSLARYDAPGDEHGHRLYAVKADVRSDHPGQIVGAGIGWYQWGDDRGVFVEFEAIGATREAVTVELNTHIEQALRDLCTTRRVPFALQQVRSRLKLAEVTNVPTCALVLAIFQTAGW